MNVLSKITRRQLAGNRTRTAVTVIGIILSVAMITAVTTLMASLYDYGVRAAKDIRGNWYAKLGAANVWRIYFSCAMTGVSLPTLR